MIYLFIVLSLNLPHQVNIFGGFAPASQTAVELSKALGSRTVMSGSISRGKNDPTQSLQMIERPLMTPDELKTMPKGGFVVMKTGVHPMQVQLRLFLDWGIRFRKPYEVPETAQRKVAYANKEGLEAAILQKHPPAIPVRNERPQPPLREERPPLPRRPVFRERAGDDL